MDTLLNGLIWIGALAACAGIFVVWNLVGLAILRSFGIDAHLRFGKRRAETDIALRRLGLFNYVVVAGILLFGWPLCAGFAASGYIIDLQDRVSDAHLLRDFVIWTVGGILSGLVAWKWDKPEEASSADSVR